MDNFSYRRILAVDTSTFTQSVAVLDGDNLLTERVLKTRAGHAGTLLNAISGALDDCSVSLQDLDLLICGSGPGSFTGLRIGLAALKAFSFAQGTPLASISSLQGMARAVGPVSDALIIPVVDARKGEVYAGVYAAGDPVPTCLVSDRATPPAQLAELVAPFQEDYSGGVILVGTGLRKFRAPLLEGFANASIHTRTLDASFDFTPASQLAFIARHTVQPDTIPDLNVLEPNYQRASEAEINASKKRTP